MAKLIRKKEIEEAREGLKTSLDEMLKNYKPGYIIVPKGSEIENDDTISMMKVSAEDINIFTMGLYILNSIENIILSKNYTINDILYLLEVENKLSIYLYSTRYEFKPIGIEVPDCNYLKTVHSMCRRIKDNLEITVKNL